MTMTKKTSTHQSITIATGSILRVGQLFPNSNKSVERIMTEVDKPYWAYVTLESLKGGVTRTENIQVLTKHGKELVEKNIGPILEGNPDKVIEPNTGKYAILLERLDEVKIVGFIFNRKVSRAYRVAEMNSNFVYLRESTAWVVEKNWQQSLTEFASNLGIWKRN